VTDEPKTKPDLAARLGDAIMATLTHDQTVAVRNLLETGATRDFFRTLADFADAIDERVTQMQACEDKSEPEQQRLPDVGGAGVDENLKQWLEREREPTNVH
jgi:hypothetical protein